MTLNLGKLLLFCTFFISPILMYLPKLLKVWAYTNRLPYWRMRYPVWAAAGTVGTCVTVNPKQFYRNLMQDLF